MAAKNVEIAVTSVVYTRHNTCVSGQNVGETPLCIRMPEACLRVEPSPSLNFLGALALPRLSFNELSERMQWGGERLRPAEAFLLYIMTVIGITRRRNNCCVDCFMLPVTTIFFACKLKCILRSFYSLRYVMLVIGSYQ